MAVYKDKYYHNPDIEVMKNCIVSTAYKTEEDFQFDDKNIESVINMDMKSQYLENNNNIPDKYIASSPEHISESVIFNIVPLEDGKPSVNVKGSTIKHESCPSLNSSPVVKEEDDKCIIVNTFSIKSEEWINMDSCNNTQLNCDQLNFPDNDNIPTQVIYMIGLLYVTVI